MDKATITIDGKEYALKKLNVGEWLELAKTYDEMAKEETNTNYVNSRCKIVKILFGLNDEEILNIPAEYILPLYIKGYEKFKDMLTSKLNEKKSEEETPTAET